MGYRLFTPSPDSAPPRPVHLELSCDGSKLVHEPRTVFSEATFPAQRTEASRRGWLIRPNEKSKGYVVLGPCCSGKQRETRDDE
jgi:hypothetical protein